MNRTSGLPGPLRPACESHVVSWESLDAMGAGARGQRPVQVGSSRLGAFHRLTSRELFTAQPQSSSQTSTSLGHGEAPHVLAAGAAAHAHTADGEDAAAEYAAAESKTGAGGEGGAGNGLLGLVKGFQRLFLRFWFDEPLV